MLGADSTSSLVASPGGFHYFNHNQKLFELGEGATLAAMTWGLGGLGSISYRTMLADFASELEKKPAATVEKVAARWSEKFWGAYTSSEDTKPLVDRCKTLAAKTPFVAAVANPPPTARTLTEENELKELTHTLYVGFCIGGYVLPNRTPMAFHMGFSPLATTKPVPVEIPMNAYLFWGAPNMIQRLIFGADDALVNAIVGSGHWTGGNEELNKLLDDQRLAHPILPVRDAIDFVHACIYSTIKAMKFSNLAQICGGPIELAVITTDRRFRWVRHKEWDTAVSEGMP